MDFLKADYTITCMIGLFCFPVESTNETKKLQQQNSELMFLFILTAVKKVL